jgi:hypothetical protein
VLLCSVSSGAGCSSRCNRILAGVALSELLWKMEQPASVGLTKLLPNTPSYLFGATPLLLLLESSQETGEQQVVTLSGTYPVKK